MKKFGKFFGIGILTTLIDYIFFTIVARMTGNEILWIATLAGGFAGTIAGYLLNSKLVWKKTGKSEIVKFFTYNIIKVLTFKELFTFIFSLITPVYEVAYSIVEKIGLPFDYDFIESTGIFCFTALVSMIISYFVYDKIVFTEGKGHKKNSEAEELVDDSIKFTEP